MRMKNMLATVMVGALSLSVAACGKSGSPGDSSAGEKPTFPVAENVAISGSPVFDRIKKNGKIAIGVKDDQPGLGYRDATTNSYTGFDIDIASYLAGQLGFDTSKIDFKPVPSSSREAAISNGDVDLYVGTYTINDKRKQQVGFAGPYFVAGQGLLVRKDDNEITGPDKLKGKKVCSVTGSTPIQNVRAKGLTEPQNVVELQKYSDCVTQLDNKQVDVLTTDDAILKGYAAQEPDKLKVVGEAFTTEPYGVGLNKNDKVLRNKLNDFLQKAIDDGTWQKYYDDTLGKSGASAKKPTIDRY